MKNDGMNTARMHSIASSRGTAVSALPRRTARAIDRRVLHLRVDVLDLDGRLVHQDADRQRQAAQRHQVDRLPGQPQGDHGAPSRAKRDVQHDDDHAPPVAQEQQHHQPGQDGPEQPLDADAPHGPRDVRRLVELEADLDVLGQRPPASAAGSP